MEIIENEASQALPPNNLVITEEGKAYLRETKKWAKFLAILGFILTGIIVLMALFMSFLNPFNNLPSEDIPFQGFTFLFSFVYLLFAALQFFPCLYLYRFADKLDAALLNNHTQTLQEALRNQKSLFKFIGVFTAILLALYGLMALGGILGGVVFGVLS